MNFASKSLKSRLSARAHKGKPVSVLVLAVWLLGMFLATLPVHATTYYVDVTNGMDSWSGTSPTHTGGTTGPWKNFMNINYGGNHPLVPGTTVSVAPGVLDHSDDAMATALWLAKIAGTSNNPIVISNYPFGSFTISNSGTIVNAFLLTSCAWVKVFGINVTNAYVSGNLQGITNCEIAYCSFGDAAGLNGITPFVMWNGSQSNWFHNNVVGPACPGYSSGGDGGANVATFGSFYSTTDFTRFNIIESNTFYHGGHAALSVYGPSNVIRYNWGHSAPWYAAATNIYWGSRVLDIGGTIGNYNLVYSNNWDYAGYVPDEGCHGVELSDPVGEIIRQNVFANSAANGIMLYGGKVGGTVSVSNYMYNNTIAFSGFNSTYLSNGVINGVVTNGTLTNISYPAYQTVMGFANTAANFVVNNLAYDNFANGSTFFDGYNIDIARWANNLTNADPLWMNTNNSGGEFVLTPPNFNLQFGSPAIDAGTWLAYITSASGSGTSFTVDNAGYFWGTPFSAGNQTVYGDTIQLQGQFSTATITAIFGNTITVNTSLSWTNGQGLALAYAGAAPDAGAYEYYASPLTAPLNVHVVPQ